ncbi:TetR family transcriptional regulator [Arcicella aurantiaca]|uniref:TetR family transcriptional regulator n=1 Tax=Arcicella aurantiaca TaxID=591202 RepID=A0A316DLJ1_9BACT|nr:TetR/AcrR family transcriptional regulator [Arcicella aurantiaca]PWK17603.1 TetR family transcriptional regulator [Arcicella aurantiaca]
MYISKQRQIKKDMKLLIVNTILDVFKDENIKDISVRTLANKINYSPATIYLYFKNKNEILSAVSQRGFWMLLLKTKSRINTAKNTLEKLYLQGNEYVDFALENPQIYELMFLEEVYNEQIDFLSGKNYKQEYNDLLYQLLEESVQQKIIEHSQIEIIISNWHAFLHGYSCLRIKNRMCEPENIIQFENTDKKIIASFFELLNQRYFQKNFHNN